MKPLRRNKTNDISFQDVFSLLNHVILWHAFIAFPYVPV